MIQKDGEANVQYLNMHSSSSCPSVEEFDQNIKTDRFELGFEEKERSNVEENDPFVTGRFCGNSVEGT